MSNILTDNHIKLVQTIYNKKGSIICVAEENETHLIPELYKNYPILITGAGFANVIKAMQVIPKQIEIINIGFAGAKGYKIDDFLEVGISNTYNPIAKNINKPITISNSNVICYTAGDFLTTNEHIKETHALVDMELYVYLALGYRNIKAYKKVSDKLNYKEYKNYDRKS